MPARTVAHSVALGVAMAAGSAAALPVDLDLNAASFTVTRNSSNASYEVLNENSFRITGADDGSGRPDTARVVIPLNYEKPPLAGDQGLRITKVTPVKTEPTRRSYNHRDGTKTTYRVDYSFSRYALDVTADVVAQSADLDGFRFDSTSCQNCNLAAKSASVTVDLTRVTDLPGLPYTSDYSAGYPYPRTLFGVRHPDEPFVPRDLVDIFVEKNEEVKDIFAQSLAAGWKRSSLLGVLRYPRFDVEEASLPTAIRAAVSTADGNFGAATLAVSNIEVDFRVEEVTGSTEFKITAPIPPADDYVPPEPVPAPPAIFALGTALAIGGWFKHRAGRRRRD